MSTAQRRRGHSLHLDLPNGRAEQELPPVAAIFLILFDVKAGYTIAWKRSIPGLELDESVEFKSLPSGLHHVEKDLIYFIHDDDFAGISAFNNSPAEASDRNVLMLAVGALVPLSYGRLGKSWRYAEELIELARQLAQDPTQTSQLEDFWSEHRINEDDAQGQASQIDSPSVDKVKRRQTQTAQNGHAKSRSRAISSASALAPPGQSLSSHHPALSLPAYLEAFGPLIFPIYKAALLRKRLLIVGHAPVELACNFVYDISILSGIPSSVADLLPLEPLPTRLHPLFSVGIHDMSLLSSDPTSPSDGWIACTTDDILAHKPTLYDTLITLPPIHSANAKEKVWPTIKPSSNNAPSTTTIKATQRDLRRYRTLRRELQSYPTSNAPTSRSPCSAKPSAAPATDSETASVQSNQDPYPLAVDTDALSTHSAQLAEPQSWSALAYDSFMWWASAGEKRTDLDEEEEGDALLLRRRAESPARMKKSSKSPGGRSLGGGGGGAGGGMEAGSMETTMIAYFHRLTVLILKTLADVVDAADDDAVDVDEGAVVGHAPSETPSSTAEAVPITGAPGQAGRDQEPEGGEAGDGGAVVQIESEDMARMGLDVWSESDRDFVVGLVGLYWGRRAVVSGGKVDVCGIRLC